MENKSKGKNKDRDKDRTYESAIKELEDIIEKMEKGDMPLDESIARFQEAMELAAFCNEKLNDAERRITILLKDSSGNITEENFEGEEVEEE